MWNRVLAVSLRGYLAASKYAIPHMLAFGAGTIANGAFRHLLGGDLRRIATAPPKARS